MIWIIIAPPLIVIAILTYGSFSISSGIYLRSLCRQSSTNDEIAITFDDGVDPIITPKVLAVLDRYGAKATFFIIGSKAEKYPEIVREIERRGHNIGNHSFHHNGRFPLQSSDSIIAEITKCTEVLESILKRPITLFRPPFGITNPMVGKGVRRCGLTSIGWSIRSLDTLGHPLERVAKRVIRQIEAGKIILLHDNREGAEILLDKILTYTESRGLRCVTINELFKKE